MAKTLEEKRKQAEDSLRRASISFEGREEKQPGPVPIEITDGESAEATGGSLSDIFNRVAGRRLNSDISASPPRPMKKAEFCL